MEEAQDTDPFTTRLLSFQQVRSHRLFSMVVVDRANDVMVKMILIRRVLPSARLLLEELSFVPSDQGRSSYAGGTRYDDYDGDVDYDVDDDDDNGGDVYDDVICR